MDKRGRTGQTADQTIYPAPRKLTNQEEAMWGLDHYRRKMESQSSRADEAIGRLGRFYRDEVVPDPFDPPPSLPGIGWLPDWLTGGPRQSTNIEDLRGAKQPPPPPLNSNALVLDPNSGLADMYVLDEPIRYTDSLGRTHPYYRGNPASNPWAQQNMRTTPTEALPPQPFDTSRDLTGFALSELFAGRR